MSVRSASTGLPRFTRAGRSISAGALICGICALQLENNYLFLIACLAFGLVLASGVCAVRNLTGLTAHRRVPFPLFAGTKAYTTIALEKERGRRPASLLVIRDSIRGRFSSTERPVSAVASVPAGGRAASRQAVRFFSRGPAEFTELRITSTFPFGLFRTTRTVPLRETVVVYPRLRPIPAALLPEERAPVRAEAAPLTGPRGDEEFAGLREFRPGDNPKLIHWKSSARIPERRLVRELEGNAARHVAVILDSRVPVDDWRLRARFERAVSIACSLVRELVARSYVVDITVLGSPEPSYRVAHHDKELFHFFHAMARLEPAPGTPDDSWRRYAPMPTVAVSPAKLAPRAPLEQILVWR